ncbi:MAG TPA: hypothetical protein PKZ76_16310, partial [Xanthomonadaceae bacterium]|nr:hypothetical protein [Xanthomonadaceae bacterium]
TPHHPEPDALQSVLEIDACISQARAIVRLMGAAGPDEAIPPDTRQNAAWAVSDLLARIDKATGRLGRLAAVREG